MQTHSSDRHLPIVARLVLASAVVVLGVGVCVAQDFETLAAPYPDSLCPICVEWNQLHEPFRIHGSTFYVGTHGLSAILVTSPDGHVVIDGGLPDTAPIILDNIRALGFDPHDVVLILNSHVHYDHAGGIAALKVATGARVAASLKSASALEAGSAGPGDPQYGELLDYPPVREVQRFTAGDTLHVGEISLASHATAGHTPGGTTWSWRSCDGSGCLEIVYADSQTPVSADGFRYSDSEAYPNAVDDFRHGAETLERLACDILVTTHPGASSLWERMAAGGGGLVDASACKDYAATARRALERRLESERQDGGKLN